MIRSLLRLARPARLLLAGSFVARLVSLAAAIGILVVPTAAIADAASGGAPSLVAVGAACAGLAILAGAGRYLEHYLGHRAAFELLADMRLALFDAVAPLSLDDEAAASADLTTVATRDVDRIEVFFAHTIVPAATAVVVPLAVSAAVAAGVGPVEGVVALAAFAFGAVVVPLIGARSAARSARDVVAARAEIDEHLTNDVVGLAEIRTLQAEDRRMRALERHGDDLARALRPGGTVQGVRQALALAWPFVAVVALLALADAASLGAHLVAGIAVLAAAPAATAVEAFARSLPHALASARRYLDATSRRASVTDPAEPAPVPAGPLGLRASHVRYAYPGARAVVDDQSFDLPAGESLAIVGESGSGKSTLASLLLRQRDAQAGTIELVGSAGAVDVRDVALRDLRGAVALVEQRPVLVAGSVLDNLRLGNPELGEDAAWAALEEASLADDVRAHSNGLRARLSEDGLSLSGGQRQRLSLARALARAPRILILDEATSHQDPATARAVRDAVASRPDLTVVVIAHRADATRGIARTLRMPSAS